MSDKERLEEIKGILNKHFEQQENAILSLSERNMEWLIEQTERVQELESESYNAHLERLLDGKEKQVEELGEHVNYLHRNSEQLQQNKRMREALEFYADEENYDIWDECADHSVAYMHSVDFDEGDKARKALEGGTDE